jgi:S-adenosylmethionine synthetase
MNARNRAEHPEDIQAAPLPGQAIPTDNSGPTSIKHQRQRKHTMNTRRHLFTSESVSEGHPDKIADQISDAILDAFLAEEPEAKVACETLVADNLVVITGEFKTLRKELFDEIRGRAESIARQVLRDIGYRDAETGIDPDACEVQVRFNHQSIQIHKGITLAGGDIGAGDQGLMFGYACDETPDLMPYPLWLAHRLVQKQAELRKSGALPWLRPDAKSQVTVAYEGHKMVGVETVIISTQIARDLDPAWVAQEVAREIVDPLVPAELRTPTFRLWVNPAGPFEIGGPNGDTGLTGRKIIVDTYGGSCPHGGGAFSGKDPTKVDRSAAYMARYIAKNLVAAGLARRCLVQLAYAIGVAEPVSLLVDTYGTGTVSDEKLEDRVRCSFRLTPRGIIESLDLRRPIYRKTAAYGHFGRAEPEFTWERTDQAEKLAAYKG